MTLSQNIINIEHVILQYESNHTKNQEARDFNHERFN